jgi:uncharacterized protein YbjT (DUF2867 family)
VADQKTVLITGATGRQGGAVLRELAGKIAIRAMTRTPDADAARALAKAGAEVVAGNLDDAASMKKALAGCWGIFSVQNTQDAGVQGEEEQGKRLARLAKEGGVQHFVYTSVGSADRKTGIPHFENKFRIEETVRSLQFPSYAIIRPVYFMENLPSPWSLNGDTLYAAMKPDTKVQMIAVRDIGKYGALAFTDYRMRNREIDIAGDNVTMPEAASALSKGLGRPITFVQIPIAEVRKNSEDLATMFEWFERVGYDVDIDTTMREFGITPTSIKEWAKEMR